MLTWLGMSQFKYINIGNLAPLHGTDSPNRHPLEVSSNSIHLALINVDSRSIVAERLFGVIQAAETVTIRVIAYFYPSVSILDITKSART